MTLRSQVERDGYALLDPMLDEAAIRRAVTALEASEPNDGKAGRRNVARDLPEIESLARSPQLHAVAREVLGAAPFVVRVLLFDKTPGANWGVAWHQDPAIAVRERVDVPGFSGWSIKAGVRHVHPPASILEHMLTLRLHLDPCGLENGPLRVIPGSHRHGRIPEAELNRHVTPEREVTCPCPLGGVLAMKPLLLHSSSPATQPGHRRVLHLEFATDPLPGDLEWAERLTLRDRSN